MNYNQQTLRAGPSDFRKSDSVLSLIRRVLLSVPLKSDSIHL